MTPSREAQIRQCLERAFEPEELLVKDQSHLHAGHEGAKSGKGHFDVTIVAPAFEGASRLRRHQMVYHALADLLESDIHALRIHANAPSER